jgi:hypothetical protein
VYKVLVGRPNGKRPLGRSRRGWDQNGSYGDWLGGGFVDWFTLSQDRDRWLAVVSAVMNLRVLAPRNESVS